MYEKFKVRRVGVEPGDRMRLLVTCIEFEIEFENLSCDKLPNIHCKK